MENEENKNNEIVEEIISEEAAAEEPVSEEPAADDASVTEEMPETASEEITEAEEPSAEEIPVAEEVPEEVPAEDALTEDTPAEDAPAVETPSEDGPAEEVSVKEISVEEIIVEEISVEEIPEEHAEEVSSESPEEIEEGGLEEADDLVFEEVVLTEEGTEETAQETPETDLLEEEGEPEAVPVAEEKKGERETSENTDQTPDEPEKEEKTPEDGSSQAEEQEPVVPETKKKTTGATVLKVIGLIVILLLIFVPAGLFLWKGETFRKELIDCKKGLSRTYESYYRKEIFPKLSAAFVPEWAKQMKLEEEKRAAEEAKRKEEEAKKKEEDKKKDILYGVPQVPDGLEYFPLYIEDHMIVYGRDDWLYTAEGTSLDYYGGTNVLSEEEMAEYARLLDTLNDICKSKGIELVMEVAPNKEQVYPEHYPSYTIENQKKRLLVMEEYMREHCSVPFVYPIRELAANKDQYDTYWKYDTHWNSTGAFIGMKAIYNALGRPVKEKDATMHEEDTNRGDLAGITGYTDLYTDYITEYKPAITVGRESLYDYEYDIDDYGVRYYSTSDNEHKLVVCGDSYRVSLAAQMCKDYKTTDAIHRDILGTDVAAASLRGLSQGDTLVLICIERWDYKMFDAINSIISIMQEP